ncbi:MAG: UDP-N-acetylglucosamine 2-epimerase (non-hydrolyzing) [Chloroflexi bacterium]|nr:UDP-N-acetylglucosamine 2-epimerase (non-hydrolyzing) [Chloroflexota bacterium]
MIVATVVGARPQFIKAAPVSVALRRQAREILVHTGQHYDDMMSDVFFREMALPAPNYHLGVGSASHGRQTGEMLAAVEEVLLAERPHAVLVYGDTNSTLAGALAAAKLHIPVAHVEAGMRSFDKSMPEEINRVLTDHVSTLLLCPTETAVRNLAAEGLRDGVHHVGDVMYDALLRFLPLAHVHSRVLDDLGLAPGGYVVATVHRAANADDPQRLASIICGLGGLDWPTVFPVHPRTARALAAAGSVVPPTVRAIEPLGYLDMLRLEEQARLIVTDSGGVQKEAYMLGVPCLTLREETEWPETVAAGWNCLVGAEAERLVAAARSLAPPSERPPLFGDGVAAERAASLILTMTQHQERKTTCD